MEKLEPCELNCLRALASSSSDSSSLCSTATLSKLLSLGLIASTTQVRLPLLWNRLTFSLTASGKAYLQQAPR